MYVIIVDRVITREVPPRDMYVIRGSPDHISFFSHIDMVDDPFFISDFSLFPLASLFLLLLLY